MEKVSPLTLVLVFRLFNRLFSFSNRLLPSSRKSGQPLIHARHFPPSLNPVVVLRLGLVLRGVLARLGLF